MKPVGARDISFMIRSLRWRLQIWHAIILAVVIVAFATSFYRQLRHSMIGEIDQLLLDGARSIAATLEPAVTTASDTKLTFEQVAELTIDLPDPPPRRLPPPGAPPPPNFFSDQETVYFAIYSNDGNLLRGNRSDIMGRSRPRSPNGSPDEPRRHHSEPSHRDELRSPLAFHPPEELRSIHFNDLHGFREITLRGPGETWIVVGRDVHRAENRLHESLVHLIAIGVAVTALGLIGGWWLAGRAISPIAQISRTAESISANRLSKRIDASDMDLELESLAHSLNAMLNRLEGSFEQQKQFTADASHELRTPISVLLSHCELALHRSRTSEQYRQTIETCQSAAERMRKLVDDLLTLAHADSGKLQLKFDEVDLLDLAQQTIALFQPLADISNIQLASAGDQALCRVDRVAVSQVLANLVHNAILYNRPEGTVTLETFSRETEVGVRVIDNGLGIDDSSIPHLFDRFYRVDESRTRQDGHHRQGSGLGLSICKSIIEAHGGKILVTSELGTGSIFEVHLPRQTDE